MQYTQKYAIVSFLAPIDLNIEFTMSDWPLHVTLADVFAIELNSEIQHKLADLLASQPPIILSVGDDTVLGTANVVLIENNDELQSLHTQVVDLLEANNVAFNSPEFTRAGFKPHSTIQRSGRLAKGDKITINIVSLIDMFPDGDWRSRKVLSHFELAGTGP